MNKKKWYIFSPQIGAHLVDSFTIDVNYGNYGHQNNNLEVKIHADDDDNIRLYDNLVGNIGLLPKINLEIVETIDDEEFTHTMSIKDAYLIIYDTIWLEDHYRITMKFNFKSAVAK